ncbi:hypothetical protein COCSUDRAFT_59887 [Coccomyxa subellipsoidea C-169]|uniref:ARID domain-containing protein n=1 Tax=Coccomyxa subellipsoidea (strain C-169) TaxID=574566 RepID=I0YKP2_COCSC|nr:hypothetical protein COCSUDRAFT_59887 [Coccomyxa subellipsoidea C-169]EIE18961.1 hypothetical protein COCSUDRAFT_59887 [Coccomyxa subellipsoidea C-169]|eukprot:XP_005643505.1 hypothetical protein COCSUDRAFT_59887 [Coccomyxa subellipsoidea C-169]
MFQELRLNDSAIKGEDLWVPVMKAGGYEAVTSGKLWAAMGRHLGAPKGMTDLSHRVKKAYETQLLPFERALRKGEVPGVSVPPEMEPSAKSRAAPDISGQHKAAKRDGGPGRTAGRGEAKRARGGGRNGGRGGRGAAVARSFLSGMGLIGARVLIKYDADTEDEPPVFYIGTVKSFSKERHHVDFDDGDTEDIDLSEEVWRIAKAEDEAEAQSGGKVAMKEADLANIDKEPGAQKKDSSQDAEAEAAKLQEAGVGGSKPSKDNALDQSDEEHFTQAKELQEPDVVVRGERFKVREGFIEGERCYEIYVIVGPMDKDDIKVKCWPEGHVRVTGTPHPGIEKWTKDPIEHNIYLPSPIDPYSAKALVTLHGLLYISIVMAASTS